MSGIISKISGVSDFIPFALLKLVTYDWAVAPSRVRGLKQVEPEFIDLPAWVAPSRVRGLKPW